MWKKKEWERERKINEGGACRLIRNDVSVFRHINFQSGFFSIFLPSFPIFTYIFFFSLDSLDSSSSSICRYVMFILPKWNELECGAKYGNLAFHMILAKKKKQEEKKIMCICEWEREKKKRKGIGQRREGGGEEIFVGGKAIRENQYECIWCGERTDKKTIGCLCECEQIHSSLPIFFEGFMVKEKKKNLLMYSIHLEKDKNFVYIYAAAAADAAIEWMREENGGRRKFDLRKKRRELNWKFSHIILYCIELKSSLFIETLFAHTKETLMKLSTLYEAFIKFYSNVQKKKLIY